VRERKQDKSLKPYSSFVIFIEPNDERGFFYSRKLIQTDVTGVDFHRRTDCVAPLKMENGEFMLHTTIYLTPRDKRRHPNGLNSVGKIINM
jgi:hypothetical protein